MRRVEKTLFANATMMELTAEECENFKNADRCHMCKKRFLSTEARVRDHCHRTIHFWGATHSSCNLNYRSSRLIPVIFHNLSDYDAHVIIRNMTNCLEGKIELLPITKERYILFTKYMSYSDNRRLNIKLRFIDSFKFLGTSLDKLASYLTRDKLNITRSEFDTLNAKKFELISRKGVFPPSGKKQQIGRYSVQQTALCNLFRNLQQYLLHGHYLEKIHRILSFYQTS